MRAPLWILFLIFSLSIAIPSGAAYAAGMETPPAPRPSPERAILDADTEFDRVVAEKGIDGWVSFFAEDGIMFRSGEIVQGHAAIRELMTPAFSSPGFALRWKPAKAEISSSADLGYTYGNYESRGLDPAGKPIVRTGMYVTVWRRQPDGTWKVALDLGSPSPPPPPESKP